MVIYCLSIQKSNVGNVPNVLLCDCCRLVLEYYGITDKNKGCGNR